MESHLELFILLNGASQSWPWQATIIIEFEMKLARYDSMCSNLGKTYDNLMTLEAEIQELQALINQFQEDIEYVWPTVENIRPSTRKNTDVKRLDWAMDKSRGNWVYEY